MTIRELITFLGFKIDNGTLKEYERKVESAKKKSSDLSNAVGGIGKAVKLIGGVAAAAGITALGKSILDTTGEVEQYRVTLGTMIGDQEKANQIIHDLDYSPVSDFYGTAAAIGGLQGMVTFGMQAEDASETLTRLGDIAQGNGEAFKSLSLNMGQVFAKGKADATDLKQFVGQGFDVVGEVSKMTGKSRAEIEKAGVSYEMCAKALEHITGEGGKYNKMLEKQSKTLPGLVKQFQSLTAAIKEGIGSNVIDRIKDIMSAVLNLGRSMQDNIVAVGTKAFEAILNAIADVYIAFHLLKMEMEKYGGAFTAIKALLKDVFGFMESIFQSSRPFILAVAKAILLAFKPIEAFVKPVLESLKPIFKDVFSFVAEIIEQLLPVIDALTPAFKYLGESIGKIFEKLRPIIGNLAKALNAAFVPIQAFIMPVVKALKVLCDSVFNAIGVLLDDVEKDTSGLAAAVSALTPVFETLGKIVGAVITVFAAGIEMLGPALKPIAYIILGIVSAIKIWTAVQTILNAVMAANPIGLIIIAVVGLIGVITLLVKKWDVVKAALIKGVKAVWNFIKKFGAAILAILFPIPAAIIAGIMLVVKNWETIKNALIAGAKAVGNFFVGIWETIKNAFITAFKTIGNFFVGIGRSIKNFFVNIWNSIKNFFGGLPNYVKGMLLVLATIIAPIPMLIVGAILLVRKHWDKIRAAIIKGAKAVGEFFKKLWEEIKNTAVAAFNKLKQVLTSILDGIKAVWSKITGFFSALWENIVVAAEKIWSGITAVFSAIIEQIKAVWSTITDFFGGLWDGIVSLASSVISGLAEPFSKVLDVIKGLWTGLTDFFSSLWDSLKNGVVSVAEAIGNIFTGLFDGVKNQFFGFINTLKDGWEKVKGFFGGLWDGAVNFFTGSESKEAPEPTKVNDMILTPDGTYSTHPDDTIFAMKNPGSLVDRLAEYFAQAKPEPSYALADSSASQAVRQCVSNDYSRHSSSSVYNTPIHVTVNASGMTAEQARRAVENGVKGALRDAINGSRGTIPSAEARSA
jgi:phage-related protein